VTIGAGVRFLEADTLPAPFSRVLFHGTLVLLDGATISSLESFFAPGSDYTLSCLPDAVPAAKIPAGVKVVYRAAQGSGGTVAPTPVADPEPPEIDDPEPPEIDDPELPEIDIDPEPPGMEDPE
jgi:hypothetical protein